MNTRIYLILSDYSFIALSSYKKHIHNNKRLARMGIFQERFPSPIAVIKGTRVDAKNRCYELSR